MYKCLLGVIVVGLVAGSVFAAQRRTRSDWPSAAVIADATKRVNYQNDRKVEAKYRGRLMQFVPCDISELSDAQREKGMIMGKLVVSVASPDKLPEGAYLVFVRRVNDQWQAFFVQQGDAVAKSTEVKSGLDNEHRPSFDVDNTTIRYWKLRIAY